MPIKVDWYDESRGIILVEFDMEWTWEEFRQADEKFNQLTVQHTGSLYQISDYRKTSGFPTGDIMEHVGAGINTALPDISISIQPPIVIRSTINMLQLTTHKPKRFIVNSLGEALQVINQHREKDDDDSTS